MCLATMMVAGVGLKAQEVTITLNPGWTWISYPKAETMDIATALSDFVPMEGDVVKSQFSFSEYHNGNWMGGLTHFIPGLGYMYCSNRSEPVSFVFGGSSSQASVVVTTSEPMLITAISAMGGGEVTTTDGTYIIVKGLCWATHENPTTNDDFFEEAESGVGGFSISMTDLNISTTYYVRAYAVTANGTVYGNQKTFTTRDGIPTLTTDSVMDITGATATCGGDITDNGGLNVTARGVCWSTSPNPTIADPHTTNGSGLGSFSSSVTGLNVSTTYYVRAYATTAVGTAYGEEKNFTTRNGIPILTTMEVTSIGTGWAYSGGNITDVGGLSITVRGVCWSTSPNPTLADLYTIDGEGGGVFNSYITGLSWNTTYYVRAYATNSHVTVYGDNVSFVTLNDYVYVDLGLPSGTLWATCNLGANTPEGYGEYFAWGETTPKDYYDWSTYQYDSDEFGLTKYTGFDGLTTLLPVDDAATANWGTDWRMPTNEEWQELFQNTTNTWTTRNGVNGLLFTASNGNSLFFSAAGGRCQNHLEYFPDACFYWSSSLNINDPSRALCFDASPEGAPDHRCYGQSVRPVRNIPNVTTYAVTEITTTSAFVGGQITNNSGYEVTESGICFRMEQGGEICLGITAINNAFSITLSGLTPYTTYYVRAYASNEIGTSYGEEVSFTTSNSSNPMGAIDGLFSVSASQHVYFSRGNLQYQSSTDTWSFAENQYDYIGNSNSNISQSYNGWIDLFGWGTSGWDNGNMYYQPYDTESFWNSASGYGYGPTDGTSYTYGLTGAYANADWGVYNAISNGGNTSNQWCNLTQQEWQYIFNTRSTPSGIRYAKAKVNDVNGIILLPDNWNSSTWNLSNTNSSNANFSSNTISASQWATLENAGAVFLPAAGRRRWTSVEFVGSNGFYWSTSYDYRSYDSYNNKNAQYVFFGNSNFNIGGLYVNGSPRFYGYSVRLVYRVE